MARRLEEYGRSATFVQVHTALFVRTLDDPVARANSEPEKAQEYH
jgi:hypothetical protein